MTLYERIRRLAQPFLPLLHDRAHRDLGILLRATGTKPARLLDVGGRKSPYTIGLVARVTVIDLPRASELQQRLNLGLNERVLAQIRRRRSNIDAVVLGDMTRSDLPSASFDGIV